MTKFAISPEGADALRILSAEILSVANEIVGACKGVSSSITVLGDQLGVYENLIQDVVSKTTCSLTNREEYIRYLSGRALQAADDIEAIMSFEAQSSGATSSARNTASSNLIMGATLVTEGYCDKVDFGSLDERTAMDMVASIIETKEQFPDLNLQFVGSTQARNSHIENDLKDTLMNSYKALNPGVPEETLLPYVESLFDSKYRPLLDELRPSDNVIAQSLSVSCTGNDSPEELVMSRYIGISVNEAYGSDYERFLATRKKDVAEGWKPQNCDTPKATMDHELGHQIAKITKAHDDPFICSLYESFSTLDDLGKSNTLSGYAGTDIHEFIAESWSEYRNNPQCRDCAREVSQRMIDLYNSNTYQKVFRR